MLTLIEPPGSCGADIYVGEGQVFGNSMNYGGPCLGIIAVKEKYIRNLPGRIVGRTTDKKGKEGFVLTLQTREQHIRRDKASSNICTNQGLMVTAATIYMSLLGFKGLRSVAQKSHEQTFKLTQQLTSINGVKIIFSGPYFHEVVIK